MAILLPDPGSLLTLEEWIALPEDDTYQYELQQGVLVVSPLPDHRCRLAADRIARQLGEQLPAEWECVLDVQVVVLPDHPPTVRVPDVVVTRVGGVEDRLAASEVLLAVEIIVPGSRNVDLHLKRFEYAEAGIPHYWLVDLDAPDPCITAFQLGAPGDGYVASPAATGRLRTTTPFALHLDIPALLTAPHS